MSVRRKRAADSEQPAAETSTPVTVKRKKSGRMAFADREKRDIEVGKGDYVMRKLRNTKNAQKQSIIENFLRLPSRRHDPEFYEKVTNPIDFARIFQKLKTPEYMTFDEFEADLELLIANSLGYYKEDSEEYQDASRIKEVFEEAKIKVASGEYKDDSLEEAREPEEPEEEGNVKEEETSERDSSPFEIDLLMIHDLIGSILEHTDTNGRLLCPPFRVLQTKEEFPAYYDKIKNPIDLKTIAQKGRDNKYETMNQILDDIFLLFNNAQEFSGKDSDIYRDAALLKQFAKEKARKLEEKGSVHPQRRAKTKRLVDALLEQSASSSGDHYSEDSEEDEDTETNDDPVWRLYWTIRNAKHEKDRSISLADHFLELPSQTCYPDYYDEIKQPVSLFMINKRLKNGGYDLESLLKDVMLMCSNACEYNLEGSEVYVAARKLGQLALDTVKNLRPDMDLSEYLPKTIQSSPLKAKSAMTRKIKIEMMDTDSESNQTPPPMSSSATRRKSPKKANGVMSTHRGRKSQAEMNDIMRNKHLMLNIWHSVYNLKMGPDESYWPAGAFLDLPSGKDYPEYYEVIKKPVDMKMIRERIESNQYRNVSEMVDDMRLMFENAREFNEPKSNIYEDSKMLENVLLRSYEASRAAPIGASVSTPQFKIRLNARPSDKKSAKRRVKHEELSDDEEYTTRHRSPVKSQRRSANPHQIGAIDMLAKLPEEEQKMWRLFSTIKDLRDETGRLIASQFWKLPSRDELPSYYEIIKKPMDLERIQQRLTTKSYLTLMDIVADLTLMISNACRFNETESTLFKDAVTIQKVLLELKRDLDWDERVPRVQLEIRTIFTSIFANIFGKKDENGVCYADAFVELPDILKSKGVPADEWPFTFDQIKMNIDKCRYRRLDRFQKDFFDLFEKARELTKFGSPMYTASIILQKQFVIERDAKCKDRIVSNAYSVLEKDIDEEIEKTAARRAQEEEKEEEEEAACLGAVKRHESEIDMENLEVDGVKYDAPCFAYISRTDEKKLPNHIFRVERIFKNENGDQAIQGFWVYRPNETLHLASRRFYEKEVFITPFRDTVLADRLRGKCVVVSHSTFTTKLINGYEKEDIYLCEFKYHGKPKYFAKLKAWPYSAEDAQLDCTKRAKHLSPKRNNRATTLANREERTPEDESEDEDDNDRAKSQLVLDIDRYETPAPSHSNDEPSRTYFHQIKSATGKFYSLGQFVLVFNPKKPLCDVMRINKLWREDDGSEWFSGGWFARPIEVLHDRGRMFYPKEVIAVFRDDETRPLSDIQHRCAVMSPKNYVKERPTDIAECDVFVCESQVNGTTAAPQNCSLFAFETSDDMNGVPMNLDYAKNARKLKNYRLHLSIPNEELFLFQKPIVMEKEMSPLVKNDGAMPLDQLDELMDDDTDGSESVASSNPESGSVPSTPQPPATPTPLPLSTLTVQAALGTPKVGKSKSGYILFSAEVRKRIMHENPEAGFGEVSKIVGIEWKKLSDEQKKQYEVRAEQVAIEKAKQDAIKTAQERALLPGQIRIYQCKWSNCDSQFDVESALNEHITLHHTSHIILGSDQQFVCMWVTCLRNRKDGKPFPSLPRLQRHIKEKHIPTALRNVYQNQIGRNFFKHVTVKNDVGELTMQLVNVPYGREPIQNAPPQPQPQQVIIADPGRTIVRTVVPTFVAAPNSIQSRRCLHSEAYLKYIESMSTNRQKSVSRWQKNLAANHRNTPINPNMVKGPSSWIRNAHPNGRQIREEDVTKALWKLRDELLKSTFNSEDPQKDANFKEFVDTWTDYRNKEETIESTRTYSRKIKQLLGLQSPTQPPTKQA
ncbi:unnamed protein product [Caenorhabditis bovis]|uniref:Protein polybromo-1 n=1 Tax=Caenorhabditis bovis TaxID=2654633 RepID=A0A8S1EVB1_9PELO|nr:unnamed protein product [Caenorhabditis bovis]